MSATAELQVSEAIDGFAAGIRGQVLRPGDEGYDEARMVHNGMFDKRPLAVMKAEQVGDVIAAVNLAREHGLDLSVRGGLHSGPGFGTNDGGLVIDMSQMRTVRVDPRNKTCPCRRRGHVGGLQLRNARLRSGDDRRDHLDHRHLRSHTRRRDRLPVPRVRAVDRQSDLSRRRHRGGEVPHRERARERGSLLGTARRGRELRRRDLAGVPAP